VIVAAINTIINSAINTARNEAGSLINDLGDGKEFETAMRKAKERRKTAERVLYNKNLNNRSTQDNAFSFMKGYQSGENLARSMDVSQAALPSSYKNQIGLSLIGLGRGASSTNSMLAGAKLMNSRSSGEALKGVFDSLGGERSVLKLDKNGLAALGQVLADSGLEDEKINGVLNELAAGDLSLDQVLRSLGKLDLSGAQGSGSGGGLTATEDGLPALGQFFAGLGASAEIVGAVTSAFKTGEQISVADLRNILGSADDGLMAPGLGEADARNLESLLRSMGVTEGQMNSLSNLLTQTGGQLSMNDFLNFLQGLEDIPAKPVTGQSMEMVQAVLSNIVRDQQLAKTPVFDEILTKLQLLGDQEIDDDFMKMSPALQALRGGISGQSQNSLLGGGSQGGGHNGQQPQQGDRESQELYRQMLHSQANNTDSNLAAAIDSAQNFQSYVNSDTLARQISQKMVYSHRRGVNRLKMKLNPENLGRVDIELKVKGDQLVAHISAESREAYQALNSEIESLKEALAEGGLQIADLTLSFDDQESGGREFADLRELKGLGQNAAGEDILENNSELAAMAVGAEYAGLFNRIV